VSIDSNWNLSRKMSATAGSFLALIVLVGLTACKGSAQATNGAAQTPAGAPPATAAAPAAQLTPYTAPDKSVTVGVPPGWKVTKGEVGVVQMSGPKGESISLGNGLFARNGQFQAGEKPNGLISMTMPYTATLNQKYAMIWQQAAATSGQPQPQVKFISATPIPLGKIAECSIYLGTMTTAQGTNDFETRFCSLPVDPNGIFKLFWMNASIPAALGAQERATAEAVLASYQPSAATLKLILQPATQAIPQAAPSVGGGGGGSAMSSTLYMEQMADQSATCMDEGVIRETPERLLPSYCR
jgi:hypothetical protein